MPDVLIENPILNSPFEEPSRHFKFTDDGITNEIVEEITDPWDNAAEIIRTRVAQANEVAQALSLQRRASARRKPQETPKKPTPTNQT